MNLLKFLMRGSFFLVAGAAIIGLASGAASAWLLQMINTFVSNPDAAGAGQWKTYGIGILLVLFSTICTQVCTILLSVKLVYNLRVNICSQILKLPLRELENAGLGKFVACYVDDIPAIAGALMQVPILFINLSIILGCLAYLGLMSPEVSLYMFTFIIFAVVTYVLPERVGARYMERTRRALDNLMKNFNALKDGVKELKMHYRRRDSFYNDLLRESAITVRDAGFKANIIYAMLGIWSNMVYFIFIGMLLFLLPAMLDLHPGVMISFTMVALFLNGPVNVLRGLAPIVRRASVAFDKVRELGLGSFLDDDVFASKQQVFSRIKAMPRYQSLEIKGVRHTYFREREERHFTLGPIDLSFKAAELVFIIGGNGSGKTTFAKLLTGLYAPEAGEIYRNGELVTGENRELYRQNFSAIFDDFFVFEQIMGMPAEELDARAVAYLKLLHLDHKVTIAEGLLSTTELSTGQRKRLALLTAYLEDRDIYLFDEWAADQDPEFKKVFYEELLPDLRDRGKTVFVISHDDRYFKLADRIVKLTDGSVEEIPHPSAPRQDPLPTAGEGLPCET